MLFHWKVQGNILVCVGSCWPRRLRASVRLDHSGVALSGPGVTARILMPGARTLVLYLTLSPGAVDPTS